MWTKGTGGAVGGIGNKRPPKGRNNRGHRGGEAKERGNERGKRKGLHNKARHPVRALECVFGCLSVVKVLPFQTRWRRAHVVCANAEVAPTDAPAALSALTVNV